MTQSDYDLLAGSSYDTTQDLYSDLIQTESAQRQKAQQLEQRKKDKVSQLGGQALSPKPETLDLQGRVSGGSWYDADSPYSRGTGIDTEENTLRIGDPSSSKALYVNAQEVPKEDATPEDIAKYNASMIVKDNFAMGTKAATPEEIQDLVDNPLTPEHQALYDQAMKQAYDEGQGVVDLRGETGKVGGWNRPIVQAYQPNAPVPEESLQDRLLKTGTARMYSYGKPITGAARSNTDQEKDYAKMAREMTESQDTDGMIGESVDIAQSALVQQYAGTVDALNTGVRWLANKVGMDEETVNEWVPEDVKIGLIEGGYTAKELAQPELADKIAGVKIETRKDQEEAMQSAKTSLEEGDYLDATVDVFSVLPYMLGDSTGEISTLALGTPGLISAVGNRINQDANEFKANNPDKEVSTQWLLGSVLLNTAALVSERFLIKSGISGVINKGISKAGRVGAVAQSAVGEAAQEAFDQTQQTYMTQTEGEKDLKDIALSSDTALAALAGGAMGGTLRAAGEGVSTAAGRASGPIDAITEKIKAQRQAKIDAEVEMAKEAETAEQADPYEAEEVVKRETEYTTTIQDALKNKDFDKAIDTVKRYQQDRKVDSKFDEKKYQDVQEQIIGYYEAEIENVGKGQGDGQSLNTLGSSSDLIGKVVYDKTADDVETLLKDVQELEAREGMVGKVSGKLSTIADAKRKTENLKAIKDVGSEIYTDLTKKSKAVVDSIGTRRYDKAVEEFLRFQDNRETQLDRMEGLTENWEAQVREEAASHPEGEQAGLREIVAKERAKGNDNRRQLEARDPDLPKGRYYVPVQAVAEKLLGGPQEEIDSLPGYSILSAKRQEVDAYKAQRNALGIDQVMDEELRSAENDGTAPVSTEPVKEESEEQVTTETTEKVNAEPKERTDEEVNKESLERLQATLDVAISRVNSPEVYEKAVEWISSQKEGRSKEVSEIVDNALDALERVKGEYKLTPKKTKVATEEVATVEEVKEEFDENALARANELLGIKEILSKAKVKAKNAEISKIDNDYLGEFGTKRGAAIELNQEVTDAMTVAAVEWLVQDGSSSVYVTLDDMKRMLGKSTKSKVPGLYSALKDKGVLRKNVVQTLGQSVYSKLNIEPELEPAYHKRQNMITGLGNTLWLALREAGVVESTEVDADTWSRLQGKDAKQKVPMTRLSDLETIGLVKDVASELKIDVDAKVRRPVYGRKPRRKDSHEYRNREFATMSKKDNYRLNEQEAVEHTFKHDVYSAYRKLGDYGKTALGWKDLSTMRVHKTKVEQIEAQNLEVMNAIDTLEEHVDAVSSSGDSGYYFRYFMTANARNMIDSNGFNPQSKKIHRHMDYTGDQEMFDVTRKSRKHDVFKLAVLQGLGESIDKLTYESSMRLWDDLQQDLEITRYARLLGYGKQVPEDGQRRIAEFIASREQTHTLDALVALGKYLQVKDRAEAGKDSGMFMTDLQIEVDAVTSGWVIAMMQSPVFKKEKMKQILARGAVFINQPNADYQERNESGNYPDSYEALMATINKNLGEVPSVVTDVLEVDRKFAKTPFMTHLTYGAGIDGVITDVSNQYIQNLYDMIVDPEKQQKAVNAVKVLTGRNIRIYGNPAQFELDRNTERRLRTELDNVYGKAIKEAIAEDYKEFSDFRTTVNKVFTEAYKRYDKELKKGFAELKKNKDVVTAKDIKDLEKSVASYIPTVKTPNGTELQVFKRTNMEPLEEEDFTVQTAVHITERGPKSVKTTADRKGVGEAASSGGVVTIHAIDGAVIGEVLKKYQMTGIFDAGMFNLGDVDNATKDYNKAFVEVNRDYSIVDEIERLATEAGTVSTSTLYKLKDYKRTIDRNREWLYNQNLNVQHFAFDGVNYTQSKEEVAPTESTNTPSKVPQVEAQQAAKRTTSEIFSLEEELENVKYKGRGGKNTIKSALVTAKIITSNNEVNEVDGYVHEMKNGVQLLIPKERTGVISEYTTGLSLDGIKSPSGPLQQRVQNAIKKLFEKISMEEFVPVVETRTQDKGVVNNRLSSNKVLQAGEIYYDVDISEEAATQIEAFNSKYIADNNVTIVESDTFEYDPVSGNVQVDKSVDANEYQVLLKHELLHHLTYNHIVNDMSEATKDRLLNETRTVRDYIAENLEASTKAYATATRLDYALDKVRARGKDVQVAEVVAILGAEKQIRDVVENVANTSVLRRALAKFVRVAKRFLPRNVEAAESAKYVIDSVDELLQVADGKATFNSQNGIIRVNSKKLDKIRQDAIKKECKV